MTSSASPALPATIPLSPSPPPPAAPTSSLGRQVLSEFRSMPSAASFGAPPVITTSGPMGVVKRLNGEMLRRLFSDLDTDGDGLLNRIEVSVALHRLQLSVPAPTIISFFRRLNSTHNVAPLREAINFKQFVAFATAAFDRHQQQQQQEEEDRRRQRLRRPQAQESTREISVPTLSSLQPSSERVSPAPSRPVPTTIERSGRQERDPLPDHNARIIETAGLTELPVEDRLLRDLPDLLVSRVLVAEEQTPAEIIDTPAADAVVRKSLERVVDTAVLDPKLVHDIAQDVTRQLVRELMKEKQSDTVADGDVTGLMRAAAALRESMELAGQSLAALDSSTDELGTDWWKALTEEQVAAIVQEIWRQRQPDKPPVDAAEHQSSVSDEGSEPAESPLPLPTNDAPEAVIEPAKPVEPGVKESEDVAASENSKESSAEEVHEAVSRNAESSENESTPQRRVLLIAEKSIQTGESLDLGGTTHDVEAPMPASTPQGVVEEIAPITAQPPRRWGTRAQEDGDLSDGEIFGKTRRRFVRQMNATTAQQELVAEVEDGLAIALTESVESGELQSVTQLDRLYHEHLIRSTVSSLESGEAEDGEIDR
ncbi:hypothetical protein PINS_up008134 [Pythium insidiosum]|nr:hypothetical protein PINS_up008134 [Pythium insidiosum]